MNTQRPSGHRKRIITALTVAGLAISTLNSGIPAQAQTVDFAGMIDSHNAKFDRTTTFHATHDGGWFQTVTKSYNVWHCPEGGWFFKDLSNHDASKNGGVGGLDRVNNFMRESTQECHKSLENIGKAAERVDWSPNVEVLASKDILKGISQDSRVGWIHRWEPVAPDLVQQKRRAFLNEIAASSWSEALEAKADQIRPYESAEAVDTAIGTARAGFLAEFQNDRKTWSADWAQQLSGISKYDAAGANRILDERFNALLDTFRNDGKAWSKAWEKTLSDATQGASASQRASATKLRDDRRASVVASFKNDQRSWSQEWDDSISAIASVSADAAQVRQERRQDYIRNISANRPWNEIDDRQFQNFLQDHASQKVKLDQKSLESINTWRIGAISGLSQNRVWSPELEVEFSYLVTNYPEARKQMEQVRAVAADKAEKSIADKGWSPQADTTLLQISEFQYSPYGSKLQEHRAEALQTLKSTPWSPQVDQTLNDLASVYPMAVDAAEKLRQETFAASEIPEQWSPDAEDALGDLAKAGHQPAVAALDTLRATRLAELESLPWTTAVDIELAQLAEVYPPAKTVYEERRGTHTNPGEDGENPSDGGSDTPGSDDEDTGSDDEDTEEGSSSGSSDSESSSSASSIEQWIGIFVAIVSALGMALPVLQKFMK